MEALQTTPAPLQEGAGLPVGVPSAAPVLRPPSHQVVSALLATMEDISGRKPVARPQQDDSPQQKMRALARLSEENPHVVMRLDTTGAVLYANPAAQAFVAACGGTIGPRLPQPWADAVRQAYEFGMAGSEEMEVGQAFYEVTFAPVPEAGYVNLYAVDISRRRWAEQAAHEASHKLMQSLEQTIAVVARAVEKRDPYTSGHQQRVAHLAGAIGEQMGLSAERIEGLRLGASIHDIGKIHTPSELLTRPGKLLGAEMELIRQHPQTGYDIVKDVEFPWPVAQMILQHHERMDGSGYPQGLKGEEILLEARIVAVADVVECMSSHRPYRPALGLDAALDEIARMRGRWLDAQAVDACIRLFRDKGYVLPD